MKLIVPDSEPRRMLALGVVLLSSRIMETRLMSFSFGFLVIRVLLWSVRSKTKTCTSSPSVMIPVIAKRSASGELSSAVGNEKGEWSSSFLKDSKERGFSQGEGSEAAHTTMVASRDGIRNIGLVERCFMKGFRECLGLPPRPLRFWDGSIGGSPDRPKHSAVGYRFATSISG